MAALPTANQLRSAETASSIAPPAKHATTACSARTVVLARLQAHAWESATKPARPATMMAAAPAALFPAAATATPMPAKHAMTACSVQMKAPAQIRAHAWESESETCATRNDDGCSASCTSDESCGNGVVDPSETCDDGNNTGADGCAANCALEYCGNNVTDPGEACDDGNNNDDDGCSANCASDESCGNGILDGGEVCDDGNATPDDGCEADCSYSAYCGDGNLDAGEGCDDGNTTSLDGCNIACVIEADCGDNNLDVGEQCDDGNTNAGDGCDQYCVQEGTHNSEPFVGGSTTNPPGGCAFGDSGIFNYDNLGPMTWGECMKEASKRGAMLASQNYSTDGGWRGHRNGANATWVPNFSEYAEDASTGLRLCVVGRDAAATQNAASLANTVVFEGDTWAYEDLGALFYDQCQTAAGNAGASIITPAAVGLGNGGDYWLQSAHSCNTYAYTNPAGDDQVIENIGFGARSSQRPCMIGYIK